MLPSGAGIDAAGVVLCNRLRVLDLNARGVRFSERVPDFIMNEVLALFGGAGAF